MPLTTENTVLPTPEFDGEYPLTRSILLSTKNEKLLARFDKQIQLIKESLSNKEIISTQMADLKYAVNHIVEAAYKGYIDEPFLYAGRYQEQHQEMHYLDTPREARLISSYAKKLNKMPKEAKETKMYEAAIELTEELINLYQVMDFLKNCTIKASVKKKQESDIKKTESDEWHKKMTSHKDSQKVIELLKEKAASIEDTIYKDHLGFLNNIVATYKVSYDAGNTDYLKLFPKDPLSLMTIQSITERVYPPNYNYRDKTMIFKLVDNFQERIDNEAKRYASDIVNQFVYKNASKLAYLLYHKNNLKDVFIDNVNLGRGTIECDVHCEFNDNSKFLANTSVVLSFSKFNKPFYRYPTIFKDVYLPNGEALTGASEQKMDEVFAITSKNSDKIDEVKIPRLKLK